MAQAAESGIAYTGLRSLFFMLTPNESSYQKLEDVPQYVQQVGTHRFVVCVEVQKLITATSETSAAVKRSHATKKVCIMYLSCKGSPVDRLFGDCFNI